MNLIIGIGLIIACAAIQSVNLAVMLVELDRREQLGQIKPNLPGLSLILVVITMIILCGILLQILLWAGLFFLLGEFQEFSAAFYYSVVNFTSLGYGDIVLSDRHRLLGAMEALNGVLMIGLSTGAMFAVINSQLKNFWDNRHKRRRLMNDQSND
jgi:hypothetical protein